MQQIRTIDLFCGAGGLTHGLTQASDKYDIVAGIDQNETALQTYKKNHNTEVKNADIRELDFTEYEDIDLVVGAPPCQGFSTVGQQKNSDYRNYLYKDFIRAVEVLKPEVFVMENVPEITKHEDGDILTELVAQLEKMANYYYTYKTLNAKHYGVPQDRKRFILVGVKDAVPTLPEPTHGERSKDVVTLMEAIGDLPSLKAGEKATQYENDPTHYYQKYMRLSGNLEHHKATNHSEDTLEIIRNAGFMKSDLPDELEPKGFNNIYSKMYADKPSNTIKTTFSSPGDGRYIHPNQYRCITLREAMRIQSFKDSYEFIGTKREISIQVGNAVPPLLAKAIGKKILKYF